MGQEEDGRRRGFTLIELPAVRKGKCEAFTLIELLVVVAIIALLIGILAPGLSRIKGLARTTTCLSNLAQMNRAIEMYTSQHRQQYWLFGHRTNQYWIQKLEPYHEQLDEVRFCPEAVKLSYGRGNADTAWGPVSSNWAGLNAGSYGLNLWLTPNDPDPSSGSYYGQFEGNGYAEWFWRSPAMAHGPVPTLVDSIWVGSWPFEVDTPPASLYWGEALHYGNALPASQFMGRFCIDRHMFAVCSGFVDGSAKRVRLPELWLQQWSRHYTPTEIDMPER